MESSVNKSESSEELSSVSAVSWGPDRLDLFVRGIDGRMYHKYWDRSYWSKDWEDLGGQILGTPSAVSWGKNRLDIFARGLDGRVWHKYWDGSQWNAYDWDPFGEQEIVGVPNAIAYAQDRLDVLALGTDGAVWLNWLTVSTSGNWSSLGNPGKGIFASQSPNAIALKPAPGSGLTQVHVHIFVIGTDGAAWHRSLYPHRAWESLGQKIQYTPSGASFFENRLDVFVCDTNEAVLYRRWNTDSWNIKWESLGGKSIGAPTVVSWGPNRLDLFVRGTDAGVYHKCWDVIRWSEDWESLGGKIVGAPTVVSWGPNRLDLFVRGTDAGVYHKCWDGTQWSKDWESLGGKIG
ncbi:hypothetical protein LEP1GSC060_0164 [Leptospira weilii serovar Ranarum str. ICFT]|uniref:PLL-like beta propeller domain-containing protein n=1 Tax=Leptospira weilii serovar Ranarum str. ICFT TaxID=1218598 RepID=N1WP02_9LEPT|nr:DUF346 domain-containing protein [Leptospira weilii]EMY77533.1 hypothetical protein LEP1GSC060_0164 [Leptospira weilii serovar Ranarum str. ICFT]